VKVTSKVASPGRLMTITLRPSIVNSHGFSKMLMFPFFTRRFTALTILSAFSCVILLGCTPGVAEQQAATNAERFIQEYDEWARQGYVGAVPEQLRELCSDEVLESLESDGRWYSEAGLVQEGAVQIVELRTSKASSSEVEVVATLDSSDTSLALHGEKIQGDEMKRRELRLLLEEGEDWFVSELTPMNR
jgi:hypothetical protein